MNVVPAQPSNLAGIRSLLESEGLPIEDLSVESLKHFFVLLDANEIIGAVGLEQYGNVALLRSLVVAPDHRKKGLGILLAEAAEALAASLGISSVFLLTTTAKDFFAARDFRVVPREDVPDAIRRSTEFSSLCPATATVMVKR
jgi:amino-acid N-acetyltransferase